MIMFFMKGLKWCVYLDIQYQRPELETMMSSMDQV